MLDLALPPGVRPRTDGAAQGHLYLVPRLEPEDVDALPTSPPSALSAAIEPYVRRAPDSAVKEFSDRADARRIWRRR